MTKMTKMQKLASMILILLVVTVGLNECAKNQDQESDRLALDYDGQTGSYILKLEDDNIYSYHFIETMYKWSVVPIVPSMTSIPRSGTYRTRIINSDLEASYGLIINGVEVLQPHYSYIEPTNKILEDHNDSDQCIYKACKGDDCEFYFKGMPNVYLTNLDTAVIIVNRQGETKLPKESHNIMFSDRMISYYSDNAIGIILNDQTHTLVQDTSNPIRILKFLREDRFLFRQNSKEGIMDASGKFILEPIYDSHVLNYAVEEDVIILIKNENGALFSIKDGELIRPTENWSRPIW